MAQVWQGWLRTSIVPIAALCVGGCTTIEGFHPGESSDKYYFGIVRIRDKGGRSPDIPRVQKITGVGLQFDNAVTAGYFSSVQISVPKDCRLIVITKTPEADERWLSMLGGNDLCKVGLSD